MRFLNIKSALVATAIAVGTLSATSIVTSSEAMAFGRHGGGGHHFGHGGGHRFGHFGGGHRRFGHWGGHRRFGHFGWRHRHYGFRRWGYRRFYAGYVPSCYIKYWWDDYGYKHWTRVCP